ncbi:choline dehydrogenase [Roseovarius lutimaris]|uniref:Choline dehydrogenase n=1 Tax=Roseovarius lutimaris TaxID=1005928 RepID=A0A1I5GQG3_9RHOB|nr:choline dehydrogenase [Roseovarius lutimaris]SFO38167.1 choline dehydrogenase [Roseovarius lutimaris]
MSTEQAYDYVVIGSGSAGSVVASRLSEDPHCRILVLEYGGSDSSMFIQMPSALAIPMNKKRYNWFYETEPEPHLGGRRINCPRGKVVGGSSSINGMVYVRGNPLDYDRWEEEDGVSGWAYRDCLPYFKRAETFSGGEDEYRGGSGPLQTTNGPCDNPLYEAFINAGVQAGYERTKDYNGYRQEGFARMDRTVGNGRRSSAANVYLKPAMKRGNIKIVTHALATRLLLEGKRAVGLEYTVRGKSHRVKATKEVILAGGPINNTQLLQLSGIGNEETLREKGITPLHHLPGVGQNLQDHMEVRIQQACTQPITLNGKMGLISRGLIGLQWLLFKSGLGATNHFESCGFIRTRAGVKYANAEYHFMPAAISYDAQSLNKQHGYQVFIGPFRSQSRGWVEITSKNPQDKPKIQFNYMSKEEDWIDMRACIRLTREIFAQEAFAPFRGEELTPGKDAQTDDELDAYIRETVQPAYHACGTCKMGPESDENAVVDPTGRVHGLSHLRIVDSSVIPSIVTGNLNACTIMIAERMSDFIRGHDPLPAVDVPVFVHPNWKESQR